MVLEGASVDPLEKYVPLENGPRLPAVTTADSGGEETGSRKFSAIFRARKGPQKADCKVKDRFSSPQCPEMMRKGSF